MIANVSNGETSVIEIRPLPSRSYLTFRKVTLSTLTLHPPNGHTCNDQRSQEDGSKPNDIKGCQLQSVIMGFKKFG